MSELSKRLFIGIGITPSTEILQMVKRLRMTTEQQRMEVEWTPHRNYHVTLNFLGATPIELLGPIRNLLEQIASQHGSFATDLRGLGGFPDEHHARILWLGVRRAAALVELQHHLTAQLEALGFQSEEREYKPHLTIGRSRKARSIVDAISPWVRKDFGRTKVEELILFESVMHGSKPVYEPLSRFHLTTEEESRD